MSGDRAKLIGRVRTAFGRRKIAETARRLESLKSTADFLDIFDALEFLDYVPDRNMRLYRQRMKIPRLNQQILTTAFRAALFGDGKPTPLVYTIVPGRQEKVEVITTDKLITVKLTRVDPPRSLRRR